MNLPNKLSIIRVALIPVIVILLYQPSDACRIIAGALFIIASIVGLTVMAIMTAMMGLYLILVWASWNDEYE